MARKSKRQDGSVFEFDQIDQWGPELIEVFKFELPKDLPGIFAVEPPDDVEHAREVLIPHLGMNKRSIDLRMRRWFGTQMVSAYLGDRLTDEEVRHWDCQRSAEKHIQRLKTILSEHPKWVSVASQLVPEVYRAQPNSVRRAYKRTSSASKAGLIGNFDAHLPEETSLEECVADHLLGRDGVRLVRAHGVPRVLTLQLLGDVALKAAKRFADDTERDPNYLVWTTFDAWAYWLADREFSPADECWYVGLDLNLRELNYRLIGTEAVAVPN